jgi:phage-related protein
MPAVTVLFYREADEVPALDWLLEQSPGAQQRCIVGIEQLSELGHEARRPLVENLGRGIYELRVRVGRVNYRFLYSFYGRNAVVFSHGLTKERQIPPEEITLALRRKERFEQDPAHHSAELEL